jgi:hypothetical protein
MPTIKEIAATGGQPHLAWARLEGLSDHCFLCDEPLTPKNRSGEDVLPKWLQRFFGLHSGATLRLLNATSLRYPAARIPCCKTCNNEWLSKAEKLVRSAFTTGYEAVTALDPDLLYAWLAKVFYGVLYREAMLPRDRASGGAAPIVPPGALQHLAMYRMLLQWFRGKTAWTSLPGSVFVYRAQTVPQVGHNFDYADNVPLECLALRIGSTAVVAALSDWGLLREYAPPRLLLPPALALHPIQFREVYATVVDFEYRRKFDSCYTGFVLGEEADEVVVSRCLHKLTDPPYSDHSDEDWANFFSVVSGVPRDVLKVGDRVRTFLLDGSGSPMSYPFRGGMAAVEMDGTEYTFHENPAIGMSAARTAPGASPDRRGRANTAQQEAEDGD